MTMAGEVSRPIRRKRDGSALLPPVRPNAGLHARYLRRLLDLVGEMHSDIVGEVRAAYAANMPKMAADQGAGLYIRRNLLNAEDLHAWARAQGIPNIVPHAQMHVTQAYSRASVTIPRLTGGLVALGGRRKISPLGDKGAVVLFFRSPELAERFSDVMAAGASWDYLNGYKPHVTLSYDAGGMDVTRLQAPVMPLMFGPEIHEALNENWAEESGLRFAADALPAVTLRRMMRDLSKKWLGRFDTGAKELASYFATRSVDRTDTALAGILRRAGFSVKFKLTPTTRDILEATTGENVALIKSIASQHLTEVEGAVMRSVAAGRDLSTLTRDLQRSYDITQRRAELIARDQNNKATATIVRARQKELGVKEAIWVHSGGGRQPRPSHVAYSGKRYDIEQGAWIDGEWIFPGQLINCRCVSRPVIPGLS